MCTPDLTAAHGGSERKPLRGRVPAQQCRAVVPTPGPRETRLPLVGPWVAMLETHPSDQSGSLGQLRSTAVGLEAQSLGSVLTALLMRGEHRASLAHKARASVWDSQPATRQTLPRWLLLSHTELLGAGSGPRCCPASSAQLTAVC